MNDMEVSLLKRTTLGKCIFLNFCVELQKGKKEGKKERECSAFILHVVHSISKSRIMRTLYNFLMKK